jgi:predicted metal-dependent HD superfamily phosphohydrolase
MPAIVASPTTNGTLAAVDDLVTAWLEIVGPEGGALGRDLLRRWTEPHRRYHNTTHLRAVLSIVDTHEDEADDPRSVRLAAWFHDAVYDPRRGDNEAASAALAAQTLPILGVDPTETVRLVLLTATHDPPPGDHNGALLCDADLAVLASADEAYALYSAAIRDEYAHVPDAEFRRGRAGILRRLLERPHVYRTRPEWEDRARANLRGELSDLDASADEGPPP